MGVTSVIALVSESIWSQLSLIATSSHELLALMGWMPPIFILISATHLYSFVCASSAVAMLPSWQTQHHLFSASCYCRCRQDRFLPWGNTQRLNWKNKTRLTVATGNQHLILIVTLSSKTLVKLPLIVVYVNYMFCSHSYTATFYLILLADSKQK